MSRSTSLALIALLFASVSLRAADSVSLTEGKSADGQTVLTVKHPAFTLDLHPSQGGRGLLVASAAGELNAPDKPDVGFFRECFSEAGMEAPPANLPYQFSVEKNDGKSLVITFHTTLSKEIAGPDLDGVVLKRTLTFDASRPDILVEVGLSNPTASTRYASLGIQNRFQIEKSGNDLAYLPTTRNVLEVSRSALVFGYYSKGGKWEYEPVEGWMGVLDPTAKRGIVFVMDGNILESFYNGDGTAGWFMDMGELLPQAAVATAYRVIPVEGFSSLTYASDKLVAGIRVLPQKGKTLATLAVEPLQPSGDISLEATVLDVRSGEVKPLNPVQLEAPPTGKATTKQIALPGAMTGPVVVRVHAKAADFDCAYEVMEEGSFHAQPIPNLTLAVEYRRQMPARQPVRRVAEGVPEPAKAAGPKERSALVFFGLYTQWLKLEDALNGWKIKISDARPAKVDYVPPASEISKYALVVLSDVTAESLPASVIRRIEDYVKKGGSLLVMGGPYAYGHGRYAEKGIEAMLPVEGAPFDLKWAKTGLPFRITNDHPITRGMDLTANPMVYWNHAVKVKPSGEVLMEAGDGAPLLVVQNYGKGKVACFMGAPLGEPPNGQKPFWEWDGFVPFLKNTVAWLCPMNEEPAK